MLANLVLATVWCMSVCVVTHFCVICCFSFYKRLNIPRRQHQSCIVLGMQNFCYYIYLHMNFQNNELYWVMALEAGEYPTRACKENVITLLLTRIFKLCNQVFGFYCVFNDRILWVLFHIISDSHMTSHSDVRVLRLEIIVLLTLKITQQWKPDG